MIVHVLSRPAVHGVITTAYLIHVISRHNICILMIGPDRGKIMLEGRSVLLVEDEYFIADDLAGTLRAAGARVIGPIGTLENALKQVSEDGLPDAALLDVDLHGERAYPLVDLLTQKDVPVVLVTGYDRAALPPLYRHLPHVMKPADIDTILPMLKEMTYKPTT
jgi:CheY-like chemotaxis protein